MLLLRLVCFVLWLLVITSCSRADRGKNFDLQQELAARSKGGLGIVTFNRNDSSLMAEFLDGRSQKIASVCCSQAEFSVSRNRLIIINMTPSPLVFDAAREPAISVGGPLTGGPIVVRDARGNVIEQSEADFLPSSVSLSPDRRHYALVSMAGGSRESGLYIAGFQDPYARKFASLSTARYSEEALSVPSIVDWAPDGTSLLFSHLGTISPVDIETGLHRRVTAGFSAKWSPSGEWISYITPQWRPALLNMRDGNSRGIDPSKKCSSPLEWSPDGSYLLVPDTDPTTPPESDPDALWVYRVRDGAWSRLPYDPRFHRWHWIQLEP